MNETKEQPTSTARIELMPKDVMYLRNHGGDGTTGKGKKKEKFEFSYTMNGVALLRYRDRYVKLDLDDFLKQGLDLIQKHVTRPERT